MATAQQQQKQKSTAPAKQKQGEVAEKKPDANSTLFKWVPLGEEEEVVISVNLAKRYLTGKTKRGEVPDDGEVMRYLMLCKKQRLNPWLKDAVLVGYDTRDGAVWTLITAAAALQKRAETHPKYEGTTSGVCLLNEHNEIVERVGSLVLDNERLVGAWAVCFRGDRKIPEKETISLRAYIQTKQDGTPIGRWGTDPGGMLQKCARAAVQRKAFPNQTSGLYVAEELASTIHSSADDHLQAPTTPKITDTTSPDVDQATAALADKMRQRKREAEPARVLDSTTHAVSSPEVTVPEPEPGLDEPSPAPVEPVPYPEYFEEFHLEERMHPYANALAAAQTKEACDAAFQQYVHEPGPSVIGEADYELADRMYNVHLKHLTEGKDAND